MKNKIRILAIVFVACFFAGSLFVACQSDKSNVESAQEDVNEASQDLNKELQRVDDATTEDARIEDWKIFKAETSLKISKNELKISELKEKMKSSGKMMDSYFKRRIEKLEKNNNEMQARLDAYEKNQSDWESFKREFNHDMDELGQSLKDFSIDNKK